MHSIHVLVGGDSELNLHLSLLLGQEVDPMVRYLENQGRWNSHCLGARCLWLWAAMDDETSITNNLYYNCYYPFWIAPYIYIYIHGSRWICETIVILIKMDGRMDRHICEEVNRYNSRWSLTTMEWLVTGPCSPWTEQRLDLPPQKKCLLLISSNCVSPSPSRSLYVRADVLYLSLVFQNHPNTLWGDVRTP